MNMLEFTDKYEKFSEEEKKPIAVAYEKTKELYDFVGNSNGQVFYNYDEKFIELSYQVSDLYLSFIYKEDKDKFIGYLAIGAWSKEKSFDFASSMDYIKELVKFVYSNNKDRLMYEFSIEREG